MFLSFGIVIHLAVLVPYPRIVNMVGKGVSVLLLGIIVHLTILVFFARIPRLRVGGVLLGARIHLAVHIISRILLLQQNYMVINCNRYQLHFLKLKFGSWKEKGEKGKGNTEVGERGGGGRGESLPFPIYPTPSVLLLHFSLPSPLPPKGEAGRGNGG